MNRRSSRVGRKRFMGTRKFLYQLNQKQKAEAKKKVLLRERKIMGVPRKWEHKKYIIAS